MAAHGKDSAAGRPFAAQELQRKKFTIRAAFIDKVWVETGPGYYYQLQSPYDGSAQGPVPREIVAESVEFERFVEVPLDEPMTYWEVAKWMGTVWHQVGSYFYALSEFVHEQSAEGITVDPDDVIALKKALMRDDKREMNRLFAKIGFMRT